jgi:site-specific recombinase XerD
VKKISSKGRPPARLAWDEVVAAFEQDVLAHGRSAATARSYGATLQRFGRFYRDVLGKPGPFPTRLSEGDLHAFVAELRSGKKLRSGKRLRSATMNRTVAALHSFCRFAKAKRWLKKDIAQELRTYRVSIPEEPVRLKPVELQRLLAAPDVHGRNGLRDRAILELFVQTGLRLGELVALSVGNVVLRKTTGHIRILGHKGRGERTVPLNPPALRALRDHLSRRGEPEPTEPLFLSERRTRLRPNSVHHLVKKYLDVAGRDDLSAHDLRHHFAAALYERKGKLTLVQRALGHRSVVTTSRYAQASSEELAEAIEGLYTDVAPEDDKG